MLRPIIGVVIGILVGVFLIAPDPTWNTRAQAWWGDLRGVVGDASTVVEDAAGDAVESASDLANDLPDGDNGRTGN